MAMPKPQVTNMFDDLPALAAPKPSELRDELECFLTTDPEYVQDVLLWWFERQHIYPWLSQILMAMDYLSIPGRWWNVTMYNVISEVFRYQLLLLM